MKRVLTAAVLIPLVLLLVFKGPFLLIAVVTCLIALLATHEYLAIVRANGVRVYPGVAYVGVVSLFVISSLLPKPELTSKYLLLDLSAFALVSLIAAMTSAELREGFLGAAASYLALPYLGFAQVSVLLIRAKGDGVFWILSLFLVVWAGDIFAMYTGKLIGRHKLAPVISPKKTWEGSVGSIVGSVVFALLALHFYGPVVRLDRGYVANFVVGDAPPPAPPGLLPFVALAIALNIAAQLGDLAESVIKRGAGVKDSGTLLPGHGGILDRIDALLFAAPVLWYYLAIARA